jgi:hypothetical protein
LERPPASRWITAETSKVTFTFYHFVHFLFYYQFWSKSSRVEGWNVLQVLRYKSHPNNIYGRVCIHVIGYTLGDIHTSQNKPSSVSLQQFLYARYSRCWMGLLLDGRWQEIDWSTGNQHFTLCVPSLVDISKDSPAAFHFYLGIPVELPDTSFIMHLQQQLLSKGKETCFLFFFLASKGNLLTV